MLKNNRSVIKNVKLFKSVYKICFFKKSICSCIWILLLDCFKSFMLMSVKKYVDIKQFFVILVNGLKKLKKKSYTY